jgi:hypothetical protein
MGGIKHRCADLLVMLPTTCVRLSLCRNWSSVGSSPSVVCCSSAPKHNMDRIKHMSSDPSVATLC